MRYFSFCLIIFISLVCTGSAQTKAYYQRLQSDTLYSLHDGGGLQAAGFYFPYYQHFATLHSGFFIKDSTHSIVLRRKPGSKELSPVLFTRLYAKNISSIRFYLDNASGETLLAQIRTPADGYQLPSETNIDSLQDRLSGQDSLRVKIQCTLKDKSKPYSLVIGDLYIGKNRINRILSPGMYFRQAPFSNMQAGVTFQTHPFDSYGVFDHFPANHTEEEYKGTILIEDSTKSPKELLETILVVLLDHYPFYREKGLDKALIRQEAAALLKEYRGQDICSLTDTLNRFIIHTFNDPHFRIRTRCAAGRKLTPVYLYPINGKYLVAAVIDEDLERKIPLGSEVLEINGIPLNSNAAHPRSRDLDALLKKESGTVMNLAVRPTQGEVTRVAYTIKDKYKIASTFRPHDLELRLLNDSTVYYKINKISNALQLDFINKLDTINAGNKLILDLRGNGGGDIIGAARFASYFIPASFKYCDFLDIASQHMDSITVRANTSPFRYRQDGKVIVLIDEGTACAAELLAATLKQHNKNVTIIGKSASMGALTFVYEIVLPKYGIVISSSSLGPGKIFINGKVIEDRGIAPDTFVTIDRISDLQPYNDRVLQVAISK